MSQHQLQQQIDRIRREIARLGTLRPGTLYSSTSVCGKPGCKCARKKNPVRHGPYHYLSYTFRGKSFTEFVRKVRLREVREQVRSYERLVELVKALVETNIQLCKLQRKRR